MNTKVDSKFDFMRIKLKTNYWLINKRYKVIKTSIQFVNQIDSTIRFWSTNNEFGISVLLSPNMSKI